MPIQVRRADLYAYVVNALERDVAGFKQALDDHSRTTGEPAPIAVHSLVEAIARSPDGAFVVAEDVAEAAVRDQGPPVTSKDIDMLMERIVGLEGRAPLAGQFQELIERVRQAEARIDRVGGP